MKILVVSSSIYDKKLCEGAKFMNGLSVMIRDILDVVSKKEICYFLATSQVYPSVKRGNLYILESNIKKISYSGGLFPLILKSLLRMDSLSKMRQLIRARMIQNMFAKYYNQIKPDLVNFHDLGDDNIILIDYCKKNKITYLITDHLYIGDNPLFNDYNDLIEKEKNIFRDSEFVSTVCTGMRNRILKDFPNLIPSNVFSIPNGTGFFSSNPPEHGGNETGKKIFLCVGNVGRRKNQVQLVDAFSELPDNYKSKIDVCFVGNDDESNSLKRAIEHSPCKNNFYFAGLVPPENMHSYYSRCFAVISLSLVEGFGLSFIEGFTYGKPCVFFRDLDSYEDIYDEKCAVTIGNHDNISVVNAIKTCCDTVWEPSVIKKYSQKFRMESVGEKYVEMFNSINKIKYECTENYS